MIPSLRRWSRTSVGRRKPRAHLLHIGKTGGTAMKAALGPVADQGRYEIVLEKHRVDLRQVPEGDKVFFAVRDPLDRFVSGFNSRLRRGQPRHDVPWTAAEEKAFASFATPDALGTALGARDAGEKAAADEAMRSIAHVRDSYWRWFDNESYLRARLEDVLLALWFPSLDDGFAALCEMLELPDVPGLPTDDVGAHRTPSTANRRLSEPAVHNLRVWYERDFAFLELCSSLDCFAVGRPATSA